MDTERKLSTRQEQPGSHFDREKQDRLASGPGLDHHARVATHLLIAYKKAPQNANWWLADDYTRKGRHTTSAEVTTWVSEARHRYGLLAPTHRGGQVPPIATEKLRRWQSTHPGSARITAPRGR